MVLIAENVTIEDLDFRSGVDGKSDFALCSLSQVGQPFSLRFVACFGSAASLLKDGSSYSKVYLSYFVKKSDDGKYLSSWKLEKVVP